LTLSKEQILSHAGEVDTRDVPIPKWGGSVKVRAVTIREWEIHQSRMARIGDDESKQGKANAMLLARCIVDDSKRRVFEDADVNQIAELGAGDVVKLTNAVIELSGLTDDAEDEVRGESDAAQTSGSSSE